MPPAAAEVLRPVPGTTAWLESRALGPCSDTAYGGSDSALAGTPSGSRAVRGFTLIEVMVVVLIIGIMYGVAVFTLGDREQEEIRTAAQRLHATLRLAADEAIIRGRPVGFTLTPDGYAFLLPDAAGEWQQITADRALGPRSLASVVTTAINAAVMPEALADPGDEAARAPSAANAVDGQDRDGPRPQTVLLPTGELVPFRITLHGSDPHPYWLIEGRINGGISLERQD
jgi:general secretion pathway protein H